MRNFLETGWKYMMASPEVLFYYISPIFNYLTNLKMCSNFYEKQKMYEKLVTIQETEVCKSSKIQNYLFV